MSHFIESNVVLRGTTSWYTKGNNIIPKEINSHSIPKSVM
jgi:hypothetical protein